MELGTHPATELFPMLQGDELAELAADIRTHGLVHPIVLHEGRILDGRNRQRACEVAGVEPRYVDWEPNGITPTEWVIATNLHRRHLTVGQRAAIAVDAVPLLAEDARKRQLAGLRRGTESPSASIDADGGPAGKTAVLAAGKFDVSPASVERAKYLKAHHPDVFEQVKEGTTTLNAASVTVGWEGRRAKDAGRDHPARTVTNPQKTRVATQTRRERIAEMAGEGYHESAIAAEVGVSEQSVRNMMHKHGIPTLAARSGKLSRFNSTRTMEGIIEAATPSPEALAAIDWDDLDRARFPEWAARLTAAIKGLTTVRNRLARG